MPGECWCFRTQQCWDHCSRTTEETRRWKRTVERTTPGWQRSRPPAAARRSGTNTTIRMCAASACLMPTPMPRSTALHSTRNAFLWRWAIPGERGRTWRNSARRVCRWAWCRTPAGRSPRCCRAVACAKQAMVRTRRCASSSTVTSSGFPSPTRASSTMRCRSSAASSAHEVAYVGDSVTMDIGAASAAGLHPILLDPYDDHPEAEFERIRSLDRIDVWLLD